MPKPKCEEDKERFWILAEEGELIGLLEQMPQRKLNDGGTKSRGDKHTVSCQLSDVSTVNQHQCAENQAIVGTREEQWRMTAANKLL